MSSYVQGATVGKRDPASWDEAGSPFANCCYHEPSMLQCVCYGLAMLVMMTYWWRALWLVFCWPDKCSIIHWWGHLIQVIPAMKVNRLISDIDCFTVSRGSCWTVIGVWHMACDCLVLSLVWLISLNVDWRIPMIPMHPGQAAMHCRLMCLVGITAVLSEPLTALLLLKGCARRLWNSLSAALPAEASLVLIAARGTVLYVYLSFNPSNMLNCF